LFVEPWNIDHIVPLSENGKDDETNMQALCVDCHREKTSEEARTRTSKVLKSASKRVLSKRLHDLIFKQDVVDDVVVDANHVFGALCRMEKGMDESQTDRFLSLYGLTRQHSAMAVIQAVFSESLGVEVRRRSQCANDVVYNQLVFSFKHMKQASLDFQGSIIDDVYTHFDEQGNNAVVCAPSRAPDGDSLLKIIDVTNNTADTLTVDSLIKAIHNAGMRMHIKDAREILLKMGCRYHKNLIVNGMSKKGFIGATLHAVVVQQSRCVGIPDDDEFSYLFEVTADKAHHISSQTVADVLLAAKICISRTKTRKRLEKLGARYSENASVGGVRVRGYIGDDEGRSGSVQEKVKASRLLVFELDVHQRRLGTLAQEIPRRMRKPCPWYGLRRYAMSRTLSVQYCGPQGSRRA
jgi:5-methylcytosine-specific restriction protein A